jgi:hypothetical protein
MSGRRAWQIAPAILLAAALAMAAPAAMAQPARDNAAASVTDALGCASDAALCPRCRDIGAADAAKIAAEAAARVESFAVRSASMALGELSMRWRMRSGRGPSRAHHNAVETARGGRPRRALEHVLALLDAFQMVADLASALGSINIIAGELDR